jgi:hypothetical protein
MQKATLAEIGILTLSGGIAANLGIRLAHYGVGPALIGTTTVLALTTGLYLAAQIGQGLRTTFFACPTKGCTVSIRAKDTSPTELDQLRTLATDHSKHEATR